MDEPPVNRVQLTGRVVHPPAVRELPSGDPLLTFRLSVPRTEAPGGRPGSKPGADWFDCSVWGGRVLRSARS